MITDIFARRYADVPFAKGYFEEDRRFMVQAAAMVMDRLWMGEPSEKPSDHTETSLRLVHDQLAMELGLEFLSDRYWFRSYTWNGNPQTQTYTNSYATICKNFLVAMPPEGVDPDRWIKNRISFIELAFRSRMEQLQRANAFLPQLLAQAEVNDARLKSLRVPGTGVDSLRALNAKLNQAFNDLVVELNARMRLASIPLNYHNGIIQFASNEGSDDRIRQPFWDMLTEPVWASADEQMKEAVDRHDRGDRTAAFHALCALESVIKVISDLKGWTRGTEKGASHYVDNLVSEKNGRFIEPWEGELLRGLFSDVRNRFAHGPGHGPIPKLTAQQADWAIDTAMAWTKNLMRRL